MTSLDDLIARVRRLERADTPWRTHATEMARAWSLRDDPLDRTMEERRNADGQEHVVLPTPYNVITLAERMFSHLPRIKVPSAKGQDDDDKKAKLKARFLSAFWQRAEREFSKPILGSAVWQSCTLGRHAIGVRWVYDELPPALQKTRLPILLEAYDPRTISMEEDYRGTTFVSRCYEERHETVYSFYHEYGVMKPPEPGCGDDLVRMTECFWLDFSGGVWHAVYADIPIRGEDGNRTGEIDSMFAKPCTLTEYPEIPIVVGYGDGAPVEDNILRGVGLLFPIVELWKYQNRLAGGIGTGLLWHFNPTIFLQNEQGAVLPKTMKVNPGDVIVLPNGVRVNPMLMQHNMPMMQAQMSIVDGALQQSSFPSVMYGEAGGLTAGYPMQILSQQARGRTNKIRLGLERSIEKVNRMILALIEIFGDKKGVRVWAKDDRSNSIYHISIKRTDIQGYYENMVTLVPDIPEDNANKIATWLRMLEAGVVSRQSFRDLVLDTIGIPEDEDVRIAVEQALMDDQLRPKMMLRALQEYFPGRNWELMVAGTIYEQLAQQEEMWKLKEQDRRDAERLARAQKEFMETGVVPDGYHLMPDGLLMSDEDMEGPPMGGPPLMGSSGGIGPPMGAGGFPSGINPSSLGVGTPTGTSTGALQVPGIEGLPPELSGVMSPEGMGMPPNGPMGVSPYQQLIGGQGLGPTEELNRLMGLGG